MENREQSELDGEGEAGVERETRLEGIQTHLERAIEAETRSTANFHVWSALQLVVIERQT